MNNIKGPEENDGLARIDPAKSEPTTNKDSDIERSEHFRGSEGFTVTDGKFRAEDGGAMMNETKGFTIEGGEFVASGHRAEMFKDSIGNTIKGGKFTCTDRSSAFEDTDGYVIKGGSFSSIDNGSVGRAR